MTKIRSRLMVAHSYRLENRNPESIQAYRRVLEIDSHNAVAKKYIEKLGVE
jgi:hypothetical protein